MATNVAFAASPNYIDSIILVSLVEIGRITAEI